MSALDMLAAAYTAPKRHALYACIAHPCVDTRAAGSGFCHEHLADFKKSAYVKTFWKMCKDAREKK